jgi:Asp-tRNA(Asn)/Glu-tRNA(Gln) amidotransferase A subunit family amidase
MNDVLSSWSDRDERPRRLEQIAERRRDRPGAAAAAGRRDAEQLRAQADRIVAMVGKARRNNAGLDLVVFPSTRCTACRCRPRPS